MNQRFNDGLDVRLSEKQPMMVIIDGLLQMMEMDDLVEIMSDLAERVRVNHVGIPEPEPIYKEPYVEPVVEPVAFIPGSEEDIFALRKKKKPKPKIKKQKLTVRGVEYKNVADACQILGYPEKAATVRSRLNKGWDPNDALPAIWNAQA